MCSRLTGAHTSRLMGWMPFRGRRRGGADAGEAAPSEPEEPPRADAAPAPHAEPAPAPRAEPAPAPRGDPTEGPPPPDYRPAAAPVVVPRWIQLVVLPLALL